MLKKVTEFDLAIHWSSKLSEFDLNKIFSVTRCNSLNIEREDIE